MASDVASQGGGGSFNDSGIDFLKPIVQYECSQWLILFKHLLFIAVAFSAKNKLCSLLCFPSSYFSIVWDPSNKQQYYR
jgi:hypothetical protein